MVSKISSIMSANSITAADLINLHHLRAFADQELSIAACFERAKAKFARSASNLNELAMQIPCCESEMLFGYDIRELFGSEASLNDFPLLSEKLNQLKHYQETQLGARARKAELVLKRSSDPHHQMNFPAYLDDLLEHGHLHLFDHLLQMKAFPTRIEREKTIETLSFFEAAHIILQVRAAIVSHVAEQIPNADRKVVLLLGGSGSGKSTTYCFLRGDNMVIVDGKNYASQDDVEHLIGHQESTSLTLIPSVAVLDKIALIDFPGFVDTHGSLISLGIEFALKALIHQYHPTLVVLEAIGNDRGRYAAAAALASRLDRILENKSVCILGITKYFDSSDFTSLLDIESEQWKHEEEKIRKPSAEENELIAEIEILTELNDPEVTEKQKQLETLRKKRGVQRLPETLGDTPEKIKHRNALREKEKLLLDQMNLHDVIRLDVLRESSRLEILQKLYTHERSASMKLDRTLDPKDAAMIGRFFEEMTTKMVNQTSDQFPKVEIKEFEKRVAESSLISALFLHSHKEISEFFHLNEIDPTLVRVYDKRLVRDAIKCCIQSAIRNFGSDAVTFYITRNQGRASEKRLKALEESFNKLRKSVFRLLKMEMTDNAVEFNHAWRRLENEQERDILEIRQRYNRIEGLLQFLPGSMAMAAFWVTSKFEAREVQYISDRTVEECIETIDQLCEKITRLKAIEIMIEKGDEIEKLYRSSKISMQPKMLAEMRDWVQRMRIVYGPADWDERCFYLRKEFLREKNFELYYSFPELTALETVLAYFMLVPSMKIYLTTASEYILTDDLNDLLGDVEIDLFKKNYEYLSISVKGLLTDLQCIHNILRCLEKMELVETFPCININEVNLDIRFAFHSKPLSPLQRLATAHIMLEGTFKQLYEPLIDSDDEPGSY